MAYYKTARLILFDWPLHTKLAYTLLRSVTEDRLMSSLIACMHCHSLVSWLFKPPRPFQRPTFHIWLYCIWIVYSQHKYNLSTHWVSSPVHRLFRPSNHPFTDPSIYRPPIHHRRYSIFRSIHPSINPFIHPSTTLSIRLSNHPSVHSFINQYVIHLSIHLFIQSTPVPSFLLRHADCVRRYKYVIRSRH